MLEESPTVAQTVIDYGAADAVCILVVVLLFFAVSRPPQRRREMRVYFWIVGPFLPVMLLPQRDLRALGAAWQWLGDLLLSAPFWVSLLYSAGLACIGAGKLAAWLIGQGKGSAG